MTDCIHAKNHGHGFTPCRLYDMKKCKPDGCEHREPMPTKGAVTTGKEEDTK